MAAISTFRVTQHSQLFSLFFRNRIQCIVLYQLHNSQALLNLRHSYFSQSNQDSITEPSELTLNSYRLIVKMPTGGRVIYEIKV